MWYNQGCGQLLGNIRIINFVGFYMSRTLLIILGLSFLFINNQTFAMKGNLALGKKKSETCLGCHGVTGYSNVYPSYKVPKIGGQNKDYIVSALKAYKAGDRKHGTMQANSYRLSEEDMYDIAAYLSSVK
ncbi:cytochrome c [Pseudomonadota bacterium]|nr:cytochrome c [Pseudomonadota bacterium]